MFVWFTIFFMVFVEIMNSATITVRHFPPQISCEQKEEFLKYFGAQYVKILTSKSNRTCVAYARYLYFILFTLSDHKIRICRYLLVLKKT